MTDKSLSSGARRILRHIHEHGLIVRTEVHEEGRTTTPRYGREFDTGEAMPIDDWLLIERELWRVEHRHGAQQGQPPTVTVIRRSVSRGYLSTITYRLDTHGVKSLSIEDIQNHTFPELSIASKVELTALPDNTVFEEEISVQNHITRFSWTERVSDYLWIEVVDHDEVYEAWNGRLDRYLLTDKAREHITSP